MKLSDNLWRVILIPVTIVAAFSILDVGSLISIKTFLPLGFIFIIICWVSYWRGVFRYYNSYKERQIDKTKFSDTYSQRGGIRIGKSAWLASNATYPFAKITINREKILLTTIGRNYSFNKYEITSIKRYNGFMNLGLKIEHKKDYPPFIVFWTFSYSELKANLEHLGYNVLG